MTDEEKKLVESNFSLAVYWANKWHAEVNVDIDDLISVTSYGLVKAAINFDSSRKCKFSTYATKVMYNEVLLELRRRRKHSHVVHLDDPIIEGNGRMLTIGNTIADPYDMIECCEEWSILDGWMNTLTTREREAVRLRIVYPGRTQKEYASMMGVSQPMFSRCIKGVKMKWRNIHEE